ncbi:BTB/POZ domain-containing protein 6-A-like isoform X2 [Oratosquilla oratoria]
METVTDKPKKPVEGWQLAMPTTKERLRYLYTTNQYSDLDIVLSDEGDIFQAHKLVLAMSSPVFGAMLMGPMAEGNQITLHGDSPLAFRKLLDFMYLDNMELDSIDMALEVYEAAHKYQLEAARGICSQYIISNVTTGTALPALEAAILFDDEAMDNKCTQIMNQNPDAVMSSENIGVLKRDFFKNLLQRHDLAVSTEVILLNGVIAWGKAQLVNRGEEATGCALRKETEDLLQEVRFLTMSCEEFIDNVIDTNVLTHTECIHILKAIRGAPLSTIPKSTPLNPSSLRRRKNLSKADLGKAGDCDRIVTCKTNMQYRLMQELTSNKNVMVYQIELDFPGELLLYNKSGIVASAVSDSGVFTFQTPVLIRRNEEYRISFSYRSETDVPSSSQGYSNFTTTVGDVTLKYKIWEKMKFHLYFARM